MEVKPRIALRFRISAPLGYLMQLDLIPELQCPYCGGRFDVSQAAEVQDGELLWGLLRTPCFEFPVVDGILLLSLERWHGDALEEFQPYPSLQVAAISYLQRNDVDGLRRWMRRHLPFAMQLIDGYSPTYLDFARRYEAELGAAVHRFLARASRTEVVGYFEARARLGRLLGPLGAWSALVDRLLDAAVAIRAQRERWRQTRDHEALAASSYYAQRFFSPRLSATHLNRRHLASNGRLLSLCPGHGVFEWSLQLEGNRPELLVCVDGQFINLVVLKHLLGVDGTFICHDLQYPFPFSNGFFDGVFSSVCLPEIPSQHHFVQEAIRVTAAEGWTLFDSIWTLQSGVVRIEPRRSYRFCQNFFPHIRDYVPFFRECADGLRDVGFDISGAPSEYFGGPPWIFDTAVLELENARDDHISVLLVDGDHFGGYEASPSLEWLQSGALTFSPAYHVAQIGGRLHLTRKPEFAETFVYFASRDFGQLPAHAELTASELRDEERVRQLYADGVVVALPPRFAAEQPTLVQLAEALDLAPQETRVGL